MPAGSTRWTSARNPHETVGYGVTRTILVTVITTFVVAVPPSAVARQAPEFSVRELQMPDRLMQGALLENTQVTPASTFDSKLPPVALDAWLFATITPLAVTSRTRSL